MQQPLLQQFQAYLHQGSVLKKRSDPNRNARLQAEQGSPAGERSVLNVKISPSSIKNYVSDINHFLNFIAGSIQEPIVQPVHITPAAIKTYTATAASQLSPSSLNRHLAAIRCFGRFLVHTKLLETDPAQNLINPDFDPTLAQVITRYQKFLTTEALSKSTIKNYVSDLKKYLLWARKNIKTTDETLTARPLI